MIYFVMFVLTYVHCDIPHIQRSQALPGYSQLTTDETVTRQSVYYLTNCTHVYTCTWCTCVLYNNACMCILSGLHVYMYMCQLLISFDPLLSV